MNTDRTSAEYLRQLQLRVVAGLLNPNGENNPATLAEFHRCVSENIFIDPVFVEVVKAAKNLYQRTNDCDPVVLMSEISTKTGQIREETLRSMLSIVLEASDALNVNSVSLSRYLPILASTALAARLPAAQKELQKAVLAGTPYEEAYDKFVRPVVDQGKAKTHERFNIDREVAVLKQKVDGFRHDRVSLDRTIPTGFRRIDGILRGGMRPSQLIILGARPATGKTTLALNIAANVLRKSDENHVVFISLEQTTDQLVEKIVSETAACAFPKTETELAKVRITGGLDRIEQATASFPFSRLHVVEKTENVDTLAYTIRELCSKHHVALVVIDYLQLIPSRPGERSRYESVTAISNKLKAVAKDADTPVICLAQLSRGNENESRTPRLADLRDSGAIEQDADIAALLYNDTAEQQEEVEISNTRHVFFDIKKNRNGATSRILLEFHPSESAFKEHKQF